VKDGIEAALELARAAPRQRNVGIWGGSGIVVRTEFGELRTLVDLVSGHVPTIEAPGGGSLSLVRGTGGLSSLGSDRVNLELAESVDAPHWYLRAFLVDGEMAWTSPIWLSPDEAAGQKPRW
jgi:hypothetical protein